MMCHPVYPGRLILLGHSKCVSPPFFTFSPHSHLETFFEAAVLALIAVVLVDRAVAGAPTLVRQVPPHRALKEALASCGRTGEKNFENRI